MMKIPHALQYNKSNQDVILLKYVRLVKTHTSCQLYYVMKLHENQRIALN